MGVIKKIAFLGSANAMKPFIIINYLLDNSLLDNKEMFLITNEERGIVNNLFTKEMIYCLEDVKFSINDIEKISSKGIDLIICLGWPYLIREEMIEMVGCPIINCHGSYLPDYRGSRAYMHYWANCEKYFGSSIHYVTKDLDDGNILLRNKLKVWKDESTESIHYRSCELSAVQIPYAIEMVERGDEGINISYEKARYFKKMDYSEFLTLQSKNKYLSMNYLSDMQKFRHTDYKIVENNAPRVMIVGGGILQYFLIEKVNQLGYISIVVDGNKDAVGFKIADFKRVIDIKDKESCLEYAKEMKIDAVITGATDYSVLTVSHISQELGLNGIKYDIAKIIKDKYLVQEILFKEKISDKKCYQISKDDDYYKVLEQVKYPVIVKPCDGSGSRGVSKVYAKEMLENAIKEAVDSSVSQKCIVEPFVVGDEYGVESFVYNEEVYNLIVMKKLMTKEPYYAELGHTNSMDENINRKINEKVNKIIKTLGVNYGSVNMDLIVSGDDIYMVDIGARMGGNLIGSHIIPLSKGIDYMKIIVDASLNKDISCDEKYNKPISSRLITLDTGIVTGIEREKIDTVSCMYKIITTEIESHVHSYRNNLDGCGYIICSGEDEVIASENADIALKIIQSAIKLEEKIDV